MNTQSTKQAFSEMAERTEATEWEDRLLRANVLTVKNFPYPSVRRLVECTNEILHTVPAEHAKESEFVNFVELLGNDLQERSICFDVMVKIFYDEAVRVGFNTEGLEKQLQEALLKGLDASCKAAGIPTTLDTPA